MHVAIREQEKMPVYLEKQAQIGALLFDKAFTEVLAEYSNYRKVFSAENAAELLENTGMNEYAIKSEKDKQPSFGQIYSQDLVELKTLKTYIKINLANSFIRPFKSLVEAPFQFDKKSYRSLRL